MPFIQYDTTDGPMRGFIYGKNSVRVNDMDLVAVGRAQIETPDEVNGKPVDGANFYVDLSGETPALVEIDPEE